ncbi:uncharacterized protein LOC104897884 isoform X3 [Beta vulgaris subsp. vulgaris]|uniref:uncharacterized protein LOC104897884 isoform X3 n=1 Tax=Beta vulgaris subsp. vulgaris TaxID=3555 RepID=UPI00053FEC11|nr:uncharacterized protein LOC104897884 isoform X3 [Beta vulgaris subsp. vulgaris]
MTMATGFLIVPCTTTSQISDAWKQRSRRIENCSQLISSKYHLNFSSFSSLHCSSACCDPPYLCLSSHLIGHGRIPSSHQYVISCVSSSSHPTSPMSTRLYVSGLSFRTTHESLRNAFQKFGQLMEVNLVMDKIANRPRGFAFIRYETEEESKNAIEGMHGKISWNIKKQWTMSTSSAHVEYSITAVTCEKKWLKGLSSSLEVNHPQAMIS